MSKLFFLALLLIIPQGIYLSAPEADERTLAGIIYFTNNTPRNLDTFPVELYSPDQKERLAATKPDAEGRFKLTGVKAGKYLLKFTWPPDRCTLWYRVDVTTDSKPRISVIMDAACSAFDGVIQDLPDRQSHL